jgi:isopentenyl-diphosphate delta-isomerase
MTERPVITAENVLRLFPEVNTSLIGGSHNSARNDDALEGYDEEQIRLMDEVCIVLDEDDIPIGSASKKVCKLLVGLNGMPMYMHRQVSRKLTRCRPFDGKH